MNDRLIQVLLIEDNPDDTRLIREMLAEANGHTFVLTWTERLSAGLERLAAGGMDVVLLDLSLPDSHGLDTFLKVHTQAPDVPVVVLTGLDDEALAVKAVRAGAQDYLVKGKVDSNLLPRAMRYAIERHRLVAVLRSLSLVDDLTGLHNRRGFLTLAEQQLKLAHRLKTNLLLVYADLDGLKQINDTIGHQEGDLALIETASLLKETFRESDIVARLGGDEFAVLAVNSDDEAVVVRLRENLAAHNAGGNRRHRLEMSLGIAHYNSEDPCPIGELLSQADAVMYEEKRVKRSAA